MKFALIKPHWWPFRLHLLDCQRRYSSNDELQSHSPAPSSSSQPIRLVARSETFQHASINVKELWSEFLPQTMGVKDYSSFSAFWRSFCHIVGFQNATTKLQRRQTLFFALNDHFFDILLDSQRWCYGHVTFYWYTILITKKLAEIPFQALSKHSVWDTGT